METLIDLLSAPREVLRILRHFQTRNRHTAGIGSLAWSIENACFEEGIGEEFVKELAKRQPLRVVFRDTGYSSDDVKINVEQIFKQLSPGTEVKTL